MKRLVLVVFVLAVLGAPTTAVAHPLGNFTVNRFSEIELSGNAVYVHYVLDLAEIPTFQEGDVVHGRGFAARIGRGLVLTLDGQRAPLHVLQHKTTERAGAGGLSILRFEAVFAAESTRASGPSIDLVFHDTNYGSRIGWKEVVVAAHDGARIAASTAPSESVSGALRKYPTDLLKAPLEVTSARVTFEPGGAAGGPPVITDQAPAGRKLGGFDALISQGELGLGVVLVSLAIAMFWGAAHALTPGHGKAIVAGYLVGSRGKPRHALLLGAVVTVTHTIGVFALGLVTLLASHYVVPERLYPWLTLASGVLVVGVGASVLRNRLRHRRAHAQGHPHHHHRAHDHSSGGRELLGVGVAAGLLPCPSALVVLLSAIALHRIGFGLALIVAFSLGLALTISAIGLVAVFARRVFSRVRLDGPIVRALPAASAVVILAVGVAMTASAIRGVV